MEDQQAETLKLPHPVKQCGDRALVGSLAMYLIYLYKIDQFQACWDSVPRYIFCFVHLVL